MSADQVEGAKVLVEVSWGLFPDRPERVWRASLTAAQAQDIDQYMHLMGEAIARSLRAADPGVSNWMRLEWVWT